VGLIAFYQQGIASDPVSIGIERHDAFIRDAVAALTGGRSRQDAASLINSVISSAAMRGELPDDGVARVSSNGRMTRPG
jgi:hypothetical protein